MKDNDIIKFEKQIQEMQDLVTEFKDKLKAQYDANVEQQKDAEKQIEDLQEENSKLMDMIVRHQIHVSSRRANSGQRIQTQEDRSKDPRSLLKYSISSKVMSRKNLGQSESSKTYNNGRITNRNKGTAGTARDKSANAVSKPNSNLSPFLLGCATQPKIKSPKAYASQK